MSYIRMGQDGTYVTIPGGSNYYLFDNGDNIGGWSHEEFGAVIGQVADEIDIPTSDATEIKAAFEDHFGGFDGTYSGGITPPERAEIFCQCVDSRIDTLELTDELQKAAQDWADAFDTLKECTYCGDEFRPALYMEPYVCDDDLCDMKMRADNSDNSLRHIKNEEQLFYELSENYGYKWDEAHDASREYLHSQE